MSVACRGDPELEQNIPQSIRHVFVGAWDAHPKAHARVQSAEIAFDQPIEGTWASDHFGVVVDLEVGTWTRRV